MPAHGHSGETNFSGNHNHSVDANIGYSSSEGYFTTGSATKNRTTYTNYNGNHSHTVIINNTGGNVAHNNIQPYLAVYMWKRTS